MEKSSVLDKELTKNEKGERYQYVTQAKTCAYSKEIGYAILDHLIAGGSLRSIAERDDWPSVAEVVWWMQGTVKGGAAEVLSAHYAQARAAMADQMGLLMADIIHDQAAPEPLRKHQNARVALDGGRWMMGRMHAHRWGELQRVEHSGSVTLSHVLEQVREQSAGLLAGARGRVIDGEAVDKSVDKPGTT